MVIKVIFLSLWWHHRDWWYMKKPLTKLMIRGLCPIPKSNREISSRKCSILSAVCFDYSDCTFKARRPVSTPSYYRLGSVLLQLSISGSVALLVSLFVYAYLTDTDFDALHQRCDGQTFTKFHQWGIILYIAK